MKAFFRELLFDDPGAYVLYGSKPMSWSILQKPLPKEELEAIEKWYKDLTSKEKQQIIVREGNQGDFLGTMKNGRLLIISFL